METLLLHPKIVHLPIALAVLMPLISGGLLLCWWRGWLPRRAWWIAVLLQGVLVGSAFVALETGETDEEVVEEVVPESFIDAHEEAAEVFFWAAAATLLLLFGAGVIRSEGVARPVAGAALLATVAVLLFGYRVGAAGGALVYEHGAAGAFANVGEGGAGSWTTPDQPGERQEDKDDDD